MTIITEHPHFSHYHFLKLVSLNIPYTCNGCKEFGNGPRYSCEPCNFDLHEACMFPQSSISHAFYEKYSFKFLDHPPGEHGLICEACGGEIKGYVYHCKERGIGLHPCCINLPVETTIKGKKFRISEAAVSKCCYCEMKNQRKYAKGWSYVRHKKYLFGMKRNKYQFHVSCMTQMLVENWKDYCSSGNGDNKKVLALSSKGYGKSKYWQIGGLIVQTIAGIVFGNPFQGFSSLATLLN